MTALTLGSTILGEHLTAVRMHDGHRSTVVVRAHSAIRGDVIIKIHIDSERHERELAAYRAWVPTLGDHAPTLLGALTTPPTVCITAMPGVPLAHAALSGSEERQVYTEAGRLLALYHRAAPARIDYSRPVWLAQRGRHWLAAAGNLIDDHTKAQAHADIEALANLPVHTVVPCHLDFTPGNLLVSSAGTVSVIDFERSRYDIAARDLVRLASRVWPSRPDLEHAFLDGYGPLSELDRELIDRYAVIDRISAIAASAHRRGDTSAAPQQRSDGTAQEIDTLRPDEGRQR
jgi:Ser/Thr protein kinase RdoA (MazF antagonist)